MRAISIYIVIKTVIREKGWYWVYLELENYGEDVLTFSEFSNIMLFNEVTTYDRKIKELFETLTATKLARKTNKSAIIVTLDEVHRILQKYNKITPEDVKWAMQQSMDARVPEHSVDHEKGVI